MICFLMYTFIFFRLKVFRASLFNLFKAEHAQSVQLSKIKPFINKEQPEKEFDDDEIIVAIESMMDANQVMLSDDIVFLI